MYLRKLSDGNWYVVYTKGNEGTGRASKKKFKNVFLVRHRKNAGSIQITQIIFPKEFIGKRIRLRVEIV